MDFAFVSIVGPEIDSPLINGRKIDDVLGIDALRTDEPKTNVLRTDVLNFP